MAAGDRALTAASFPMPFTFPKGGPEKTEGQGLTAEWNSETDSSPAAQVENQL